MLAKLFSIVTGSAVLVSAIAVAPAAAQEDEKRQDVQQQAEELLKILNDEHAMGTDLWIYNDLRRAMAAAKRVDRPLFVTFRCIPCKACAGFDAEVAQGSEAVEKLAREHFVPVRQIEMEGVDLSLFQFDYDLNWAAMFINADGVVYARYGTQSAEGPDAYNSIEGLTKTMMRVLELHEKYPENAGVLAGKRGEAKPYKTAIEMPGLQNKERYEAPTTRANCIHCHNIHDAENNDAWDSGTFTRDMLWRYPLPDNVGLVIDGKDGIRVEEVLADSPAARAGFQAGESITHMNGQPMTSIADMQWVLNGLPNADTEVEVTGSETGKRTLELAKGWKEWDVSWRGSLHSIPPRLRVWAPELTGEEREQRGLPADREAMLVKWINRQSAGGRSAYESGLREGDVIVAMEGKPIRMSQRQFQLHIKLNYNVGDELPLTVLREGKKRDVRLKLAE